MSRRYLVFQHVAVEHPGILRDYMRRKPGAVGNPEAQGATGGEEGGEEDDDDDDESDKEEDDWLEHALIRDKMKTKIVN